MGDDSCLGDSFVSFFDSLFLLAFVLGRLCLQHGHFGDSRHYLVSSILYPPRLSVSKSFRSFPGETTGSKNDTGRNYVVSHYVHHFLSEKPGDPYNVHGGWLYCFLADAIHQPIRKDLSEADYFKVTAMMNHTGVRLNSYAQYLKWGSVCHPLFTTIEFAANWSFWFGVFYLIGGLPLAITVFGSCAVWGIGIRTFNYDGHGGGKDKRKEGIDFDKTNLSINQLWPGLVTGEWHNNHHLYPNGARAGFQPYQLDYAWYFIRLYYWLGGITSYRDYQQDFYDKYMTPYLSLRSEEIAQASS